MITTSAHPSRKPVCSNVPSCTVTLLFLTVLEKTALIPALGSTAFSSLISAAHSGCASNARVKSPVPAPILAPSRFQRLFQSGHRFHYVLSNVERRITLQRASDV